MCWIVAKKAAATSTGVIILALRATAAADLAEDRLDGGPSCSRPAVFPDLTLGTSAPNAPRMA